MNHIIASQPRDTVRVTFDDGHVYDGPIDTPLEEFIKVAEKDQNIPQQQCAVAAMVDRRLRELTIPVTRDVSVAPVRLDEPDGTLIYRRSLCFLLVAAADQLFPDAQVNIRHSLPQRAYFCQVVGRAEFSQDELLQIKNRMLELVADNLPIVRTQMHLDDAIEYFSARGDEEKVRLLKFRTRDYLNVYQMGEFSDYFFGYMVPSAGYLKWFDLGVVENGFVLQYPQESRPDHIPPMLKLSKLDEVFYQAGEWLELIGVEDIGQLNDSIRGNNMRELILVAEALHERRLSDIGMEIAKRHQAGVQLVLLAGPTSSGKTTCSKRLAIQLMTHGLRPFTLELDNYFVDRDLTPLDENGDYDFESLGAVNVELFNQNLQQLIAGEEVQLPKFDFKLGKSNLGRSVKLTSEHIVIVEGIHGLNPALTPAIGPEQAFRVYVSALTQLNIDRHNRISTTDVRLLRRIVRDANYRGWTATDTLARWASVRRGEQENVFPYQENADAMFNSALFYELAALRPLAEPHLLRVSIDHPKWVEANRLLAFLSWVLPIDDGGIPDNSILREFIGGSNLRDYHPGSN